MRSSRTPVATTRPGVLICLDAGHGGHDPGCQSQDCKHQEKQLALTTTILVRNHLQRLGYQVMLTRTDDTFIPLEERAELANQAQCTLFVSIHYNAADSTDASGVEVFCFQKGSEAEQLADSILNRVICYTRAESRGTKEANFVVLRRTIMPAVLVEGGFLTNERECRRLTRPRYLNAVAWGITQGVHHHLETADRPRRDSNARPTA